MHRVCHAHRAKLVGKRFAASSPNGRFAAGAALISMLELTRVEAHGKNLFYFFGSVAQTVVMHVHFGMSGAFKLFHVADPNAPVATSTTRLRLEEVPLPHGAGHPAADTEATEVSQSAPHGLFGAHLSAMTVDHGTMELYHRKIGMLGQDPLRSDAEADVLFQKVAKSKKSIGALLMDQAFFPGVGNIFRAEILYKAGVHPELMGCAVTRPQFTDVWSHSVDLLRRGFEHGSILTVDEVDKQRLGHASRRRYIYNQATCMRCGTEIKTWLITQRTCYCCSTCQPMPPHEHLSAQGRNAIQTASHTKLFESHCARESLAVRRSNPEKLKVAELKAELKSNGLPVYGKKVFLVERLLAWRAQHPHAQAGALDTMDGAHAVEESALKEEGVRGSGGYTVVQGGNTAVQGAQPASMGAVAGRVKAEPGAATAVTAVPEVRHMPVEMQVPHPAGVTGVAGVAGIRRIRSYMAAKHEKLEANEGMNVEHVADVDSTTQVDWTDLHSDDNPAKRERKTKRQKQTAANPQTQETQETHAQGKTPFSEGTPRGVCGQALIKHGSTATTPHTPHTPAHHSLQEHAGRPQKRAATDRGCRGQRVKRRV